MKQLTQPAIRKERHDEHHIYRFWIDCHRVSHQGRWHTNFKIYRARSSAKQGEMMDKEKQSMAMRMVDEHESDDWIAGTRQWREEASATMRGQIARIAQLEAENEMLRARIADQWGLCDGLRGVISQIDNMSTGLTRKAQQDRQPLTDNEIGVWIVRELSKGGFPVVRNTVPFAQELKPFVIAFARAHGIGGGNAD